MKFIHWKDLTDEQKNARLKKIFGAAAVIFIVILVLLLMRCEGCSSDSTKKKRDFGDGKGHAYGEEISGADIFNDDYGKDSEDYTLVDSQADIDAEQKRKIEEEVLAKKALEESESKKATEEATEKELAEKKAKEEAERKELEEEKAKKIAEQKAKQAAKEEAVPDAGADEHSY